MPNRLLAESTKNLSVQPVMSIQTSYAVYVLILTVQKSAVLRFLRMHPAQNPTAIAAKSVKRGSATAVLPRTPQPAKLALRCILIFRKMHSVPDTMSIAQVFANFSNVIPIIKISAESANPALRF